MRLLTDVAVFVASLVSTTLGTAWVMQVKTVSNDLTPVPGHWDVLFCGCLGVSVGYYLFRWLETLK